jgi:aldose 1-epimerase
VDSTLIPTGELKPVENTPFDFRKPTVIGLRINEPDEQLKFGSGYDHNWVINKPAGELGLMARAFEPTSGRVLEIYSTAPGLQFYTGNYITPTPPGKGGRGYQKNEAFCLEPHNFPDSPNHPDFPTTTLRAGQTYKHSIVYRFSAAKN